MKARTIVLFVGCSLVLLSWSVDGTTRPKSLSKNMRRAQQVPRVLKTSETPPTQPTGEEPDQSRSASLLAEPGRVELAVRTGFGLPWGKYATSRQTGGVEESLHHISADTHGVVPVWVDAGYWITPSLMVGGYGMFAFALPKEANASDPLAGGCPSGVDCFAYGVRVGLQAQYSFSTSGVFRPWLGIGVGYEWLQVQLEGEVLGFPIDWTTGHSGPDLLHFQGGLDTSMGNAGRVGPFVGASAMQYSACSADLGETSPGCKIAQAGWHGWVVLGLRGALRL